MYPALLATAVALVPVVSAAAEAPGFTRGTIAVVADDAAADPVVQTFVGAVRHAVLQTTFVPLPDPDHSRYVAKVAVTQTSRGVVTSTGSSSATGSRPIYQGGGVSLSLPSGKGQLRGLIVTRLSVIVSLRSDDHVVWTGEASTARISGTRAGAPAVVAEALAGALFRQFPQPLAEPISVP